MNYFGPNQINSHFSLHRAPRYEGNANSATRAELWLREMLASIVRASRTRSFAFRSSYAVDKENPLKMIVLVLNGSSKKSVGLEFQHASIQPLSFYSNATRPSHIGLSARETQASFDPGSGVPNVCTSGLIKTSGMYFSASTGSPAMRRTLGRSLTSLTSMTQS